MAHFPRYISKQIGQLWSAQKLYKSTAPVFLPFYHVVSNKPLPYILNYPYINAKEFEQQLDYFLKYFKAISLNEFYKDPHSTEKVFHLSFDDGLRECIEIIGPILLRKGIPATFFINSGFVDNKELFHRYKASLILTEMYSHPDTEAESVLLENGLTKENLLQASFAQRHVLDEAAELLEIDFNAFLKNEKPYLSTSEVIELHNKGFSIGGHSHKHPEFWEISEKKQLKHVRKSMNWVNTNIKPDIKAFAFPYTDHGVSADFIQQIKQENICDITFGTAGLKYDEVNSHYQRYPAEQTGNFKQNLKDEFAYFKLRNLLGKSCVKH